MTPEEAWRALVRDLSGFQDTEWVERRVGRHRAAIEAAVSADLDRLRAALEVEWLNGNLTDSAHDRLLDTLGDRAAEEGR